MAVARPPHSVARCRRAIPGDAGRGRVHGDPDGALSPGDQRPRRPTTRPAPAMLLQSPGGSVYAVFVDDAGAVTTAKVSGGG